MSYGSDTSTSIVQLIGMLHSIKYTIEQYTNDIAAMTFCTAEILWCNI